MSNDSNKGVSRKEEFEERIERLLNEVSICSKAVGADIGKLRGMKGELSGIVKELERTKEKLMVKKRLSKEKLDEIGDAVEILEEELEAKRKEVENLFKGKEKEYLTTLQYLKAEFENYKRRAEKEKREFADWRLEGFVQELLPIKDTLEVAIGHAKENAQSEGLIKGMELTVKQINELLKREGIEEIKAEGEQFDPFRHEVVSKEVVKNHPENTVIEVVRKGYLLREKVIRPAMVKIATKE